MASLEELRHVRIDKLEQLRNAGMQPYTVASQRTHRNADVLAHFELLQEEKKSIISAGRIMAIRGQGAIIFVPLYDGTATLQAVFKEEVIDPKLFTLFQDTIDMGDFIEVTGTLFCTERGAQSLLVHSWTILTKALLPLPDKWHGLTDTEEKYRKRYLDILMNKEVSDRFIMRSRVITAIREYFNTRDFLEIETPILQNQAGGALARTFNTHHNDYDIDMVLRIAVELQHKMIMVGGYPRIYGIDKDFRNEGSDPTHLQEFTMMEWYAAYETLDQNITWTEDLLRHLARTVVGTTTFTVYDKEGTGVEVDFDTPWPRKRFDELLKEYANVDMHSITPEELQKAAMKWGLEEKELVGASRANLLDYVYKKSARAKIINPTFVTHYPSELKPLAQQNPDNTAEVAQLIIGGAEITNQYAELIDPLVQRDLLQKQAEAKAAGDDEAMEVDEEFLTAMEHGMPPMTGFGMGIDRLVAIFSNQKTARDVILFPIMRPVQKGGGKKDSSTKIAVAIINRGIGLEPWQEMNTIAHLNAAFGAREGKKLFLYDVVNTSDNVAIALNIQHPIMIKQADSMESMKELIRTAKSADLEVSEFTREMLETSNDKKVKEQTGQKSFTEVEHLGILIFGDKKEVDELTKDFKLYS